MSYSFCGMASALEVPPYVAGAINMEGDDNAADKGTSATPAPATHSIFDTSEDGRAGAAST